MKKILLSEVNRIHEMMGLKKSIIVENVNPLKSFFGKLGISFEEMMGRMENMYGERYLDQIKSLFEKEVLSVGDRKFIAGLTIKAYPKLVNRFVNHIEQVLLKNNANEIVGIHKLFENPHITSEMVVKVISDRLGIKLSPESVELWSYSKRVERLNHPNYKSPEFDRVSAGKTTPASASSTKPTASTPPQTISQMEPIKPTGSAPMGRIQEPHEFTIEGLNAGYKVYKGGEKNALGDLRGMPGHNYSQSSYTKESIINGKKVFTYVDMTQVDYVGRPAYASISISLPLETKLKLNDVLPELKSKLSMEQKPGGVMYNDYMKHR
jgi:hypothetical protein